MRNAKALMMLGIAVVAGLAAVVLATQWIAEQARVGSSKVVVAVADLELGSRIHAQAIRLADWPSGSVPPGAFSDLAELEGRVARTALTRGEPILESKLAPVGTRGGLSAVVSEGKRAMTVRVNDVVGVAGFALPGNYVDIMVHTDHAHATRGDRALAISKIVLERILVLAVAQEASRDETKPRVVNAVTLEVTPEQAEKLDLARSVGSLSLVLRNQIDGSRLRTAGARKSDLLQIASERAAPPAPQRPRERVIYRAITLPPSPQPPESPAPAKRTVEVIKGMNRSSLDL
jgi:pilus assembly protein CpaB